MKEPWLVTFFAVLLGLALFTSAHEMQVTSPVGALIPLGYYLSAIGFLVATIMMGLAVRQFGRSTFGEIFTYFVVGTGTFFVITVFQQLGPDFFRISEESMDVWWHLMFYIAMISYYKGVKSLVDLGSDDPTSSGLEFSLATDSNAAEAWGGSVVLMLIAIFIVPHASEPFSLWYLASPLGTFGLHHFIAFILAGMVGWYLFKVKKTLGPISAAVALPLITTIWALSLQHLWELQFESWKTVIVPSSVGEGGEKIFLTIAGIGVAYAGWRLAHFHQDTTTRVSKSELASDIVGQSR